MPQPISLVRVNSILPFVAFLDNIGAPKERFLQKARIPVSALNNPENLIPLSLGCELIESIANHEGIKNLGIEIGHQVAIDQLGAYGRLLCQSLTLHDLLSVVTKTVHFYCSGDRVYLTYQEDQVLLHHYSCLPTHRPYQQENHYALMLYLNAIQLVSGPEWQPSEIHLMSGRCRYLTQLDLFASTRFLFEQSTDAIRFPRSFLQRSLRHSSPSSKHQRQQDEWLLHKSAPAVDFPKSVQQILRLLLPEGYPDIHLVAEITGMSVRSLQRRLAEVGLSYSRLVEQVRFDAAIDYLQNSDTKLIDIALELGYRDPANFTRAFKRWTGVSPRAFRDQLLQDEAEVLVNCLA